jgi:beta-glucosidase
MKKRYFTGPFIVAFLIVTGCNHVAETASSTVQYVSENERKADSLLKLMTVEEKVGQMLNVGLAALLKGEFYADRDSIAFDTSKVHRLLVKYGAGSVQNLGNFPLSPAQWRQIIGYIQETAMQQTRLGIPVLYGIDAAHGAHYTKGSVMFPHQINLAASFNTELVKEVAAITAYEVKAGAIPWNYSPVLDVARHPMWGRIFESFGEDSHLVTVMGGAMLEGLQGGDPSAPGNVIACAKHFVGYGAAYNGKDRAPVYLPERAIRQILLPPFERAIEMGLPSVMVSSGAMNGIPSHVDYQLITGILKGELGFKGVVISDWNDIDNLYKIHRVAHNEREAVKQSILAGIDICMEPYDGSFAEHLTDLVHSGEVPMSRIDDAVRRILCLKYKSGVFEDPLFEAGNYSEFASGASDSLNYLAACESITLLKNKRNFLPMEKGRKVLVTGVAANSINYLNGGWSRTWAGQDTRYNDLDKPTILEAIRKKIGHERVIYVQGTSYTEDMNTALAVKKAAGADYIIACVGEIPATEKPSDINELDLPEAQQELVKGLASTGKPVVLVMVQGRPRIIREIEPLVKSVVMAFLPGNEGGRAVADVLFGDHNPSGRLPYTYPRFSGSLWTYDHPLSDERDVNFGLNGFQPQYEFGHGLSYTSFEYSDLKVSADSFKVNHPLDVEISIRNRGLRAGKEAVLLFVADEVASVSPAVKQLKRFAKIDIKPGEEEKVKFTLHKSDLEFVGQSNTWVFEPGYFTLSVGTRSKRIYVYHE